jgi:hypothetical protein
MKLTGTTLTVMLAAQQEFQGGLETRWRGRC